MSRKKRTKIMVTIFCILVALISGFTYFAIADLKQEDILKREIDTLLRKPIKDFNSPIKTKGDYGIVEKVIKEYLEDYALTLQEALNIMNDDKIQTLLTAKNYKEDGPEFINTKNSLEEIKKELDEKVNKLTDMTKPEMIKANIEDKKLDKNYITLYNEIFKNIKENYFKNTQKLLKNSSDRDKTRLDVELEIISFLISSKNNWSVEEDKIAFKNTEDLNKYNELRGKLKKW